MAVVSKGSEYISLKQAAEISGYSADYVGQLIRRGKLPGKQVFLNVAWVTTEDDLKAYLDDTKKKGGSRSSRDQFEKLLTPENLSRAYSIAVVSIITFFAVVILFLGYVLAVSVDNRIEQKYLEKLEAKKL